MGVWKFIQDQFLGMKWLNELIGMGLSMAGLDVEERLGGSVQFFLYDMLKITVLLCFLIFVISYIQSYFPPERSKQILGRFHGISANIISALLGTVTPFCSCSSIPLFIGFTSFTDINLIQVIKNTGGAVWEKNKECAKHIPAPSAVACDKSQFRASAHPPGGFLYRERSFLYNRKKNPAKQDSSSVENHSFGKSPSLLFFIPENP